MKRLINWLLIKTGYAEVISLPFDNQWHMVSYWYKGGNSGLIIDDLSLWKKPLSKKFLRVIFKANNNDLEDKQ